MNKKDQYIVNGYLPSIGIECHVQLKTKTKLFSGVSNDARNAQPNTLISHIDLGMPGALPVLNQQAVNLACKAAFALNTKPSLFSKFDRKHYFYPDLPKGYQITQFDQPIIIGGYVEINLINEKHKIRVARAHLEEDAGKLTHPSGADYSLVDLNRAGTPLLEIVSEADMHSAQEARAYAQELYILMRYADVSEGDLYHGNMRFDVNVSVSSSDKLGVRTETKNLNSFKSVEKAVEYEIARQIELLENGNVVTQETRGWDDAKQKTFSQRSKEEAHDYRYFAEPDVPPIVLKDADIESIGKTMPIMPAELREKLQHLQLDKSTIQTLIQEIPAGRFMLKILDKTSTSAARKIANWLVVDVQAITLESNVSWESINLSVDSFIELASMIDNNSINSSAAKTIIGVMLHEDKNPLVIAKEHDLLQSSDESEIQKIVENVIHANPTAVADIKKGELKAIGFLVGQVMKESKGKANPQVVQDIVKKLVQ